VGSKNPIAATKPTEEEYYCGADPKDLVVMEQLVRHHIDTFSERKLMKSSDEVAVFTKPSGKHGIEQGG